MVPGAFEARDVTSLAPQDDGLRLNPGSS